MKAAGRCILCGCVIPRKPKTGYHSTRLCGYHAQKEREYARLRYGCQKRWKQLDATFFDWRLSNSALARLHGVSRDTVALYRSRLCHTKPIGWLAH